MKFNKSAESDFWYVGDDYDNCVGLIQPLNKNGEVFFNGNLIPLNANQMQEIVNKMKEVNLIISIDTTSTFTSNSQ